MSALLLQTVLLGFVCHGDLYFIDLSCADCPLYFWAHVLANCTNSLILLLSDICCNTLTQHKLTCSDSCAFPSHKHRLVHIPICSSKVLSHYSHSELASHMQCWRHCVVAREPHNLQERKDQNTGQQILRQKHDSCLQHEILRSASFKFRLRPGAHDCFKNHPTEW